MERKVLCTYEAGRRTSDTFQAKVDWSPPEKFVQVT